MFLSSTNMISRMRIYLRLTPFEVSTPGGRAMERNRRLLLTSLATLLVKIIAMLTLIISTPLILHYLGAERFGLWMTISSLIVVLGFVDLGIGNGLLNIIADAHGREDNELAIRAVTSSFLMLTIVGVVLVLAFAGAYAFVDWGHILNVFNPTATYEASVAAAVLTICLAINLPLLTAQKVQLGYQDGFQANLWQAVGSIFMLLGIFSAIYLKASLPWLRLADQLW